MQVHLQALTIITLKLNLTVRQNFSKIVQMVSTVSERNWKRSFLGKQATFEKSSKFREKKQASEQKLCVTQS